MRIPELGQPDLHVGASGQLRGHVLHDSVQASGNSHGQQDALLVPQQVSRARCAQKPKLVHVDTQVGAHLPPALRELHLQSHWHERPGYMVQAHKVQSLRQWYVIGDSSINMIL